MDDWLLQVKLNIHTKSKAWRSLRNKLLSSLSPILNEYPQDLSKLSANDKMLIIQKLEKMCENDVTFTEARVDALNRMNAYFMNSISRKNTFDAGLKETIAREYQVAFYSLLKSRPDMVSDLKYCMNATLSPALRRLSYQHLLINSKLVKEIEQAFESTKMAQIKSCLQPNAFKLYLYLQNWNISNVYHRAQSFLSSVPFFNYISHHFKCVMRLESIILYFIYIHIDNPLECKDILEEGVKLFDDTGLTQICRLSVPFIKVYELDDIQEDIEPLPSEIFISIIFNLYDKIPLVTKSWTDPMNTTRFLTSLESYLGQLDNELLSLIQSCFSKDPKDIMNLFSNVMNFMFLGVFPLDINLYMLDQFLFCSSDVNLDSRFPSFDNWRLWFFASFLLQNSNSLKLCKTSLDMIAKMNLVFIPQTTLSSYSMEVEKRFVSIFRKTMPRDIMVYSNKNMIKSGVSMSLWDEDVVPLSEAHLIYREDLNFSEYMKDWTLKKPQKIAKKIVKALFWIKIVKKLLAWIRFFQGARQSIQQKRTFTFNQSIAEKKRRDEELKLAQEKVKQSEKEAFEKERLKQEAKQKEMSAKEDESSRLEEERKKLAMKSESGTTNSASVLLSDSSTPGRELEHLNEMGKLVILGLDQMNYGIGGFGHHADRKLYKVLKDSVKMEKASNKDVKLVQMSLFKRELSLNDVKSLNSKDKIAYFKALDARMMSTSDLRKSNEAEIEEVEQYVDFENAMVEAINRMNLCFLGTNAFQKTTVVSAKNGAEICRKWELDVAKKVWEKDVSQTEMESYLRPNVEETNSDLIKKELERRRKRDIFFKKIDQAQRKWI